MVLCPWRYHSASLWFSSFLSIFIAAPFLVLGWWKGTSQKTDSIHDYSHIHTWLLEKNIALTIQTFVSKVISLLFNTLSRFLIAFLPRSKCLLISWLKSLSTVILEPKERKPVTASTFPPSIWHEVIGLHAMICFECWGLSQLFHSPLSPSEEAL